MPKLGGGSGKIAYSLDGPVKSPPWLGLLSGKVPTRRLDGCRSMRFPDSGLLIAGKIDSIGEVIA